MKTKGYGLIFSLLCLLTFLAITLKFNVVYCQETTRLNLDLINEIKEDLVVILKQYLKQEDFKNHYGRNSLYPYNITLLYQKYICNELFIKNFLDKIPLERIIYDNSHKGYKNISDIVFGLYIKEIESNIKSYESILDLFTNSTLMVLSITKFLLIKSEIIQTTSIATDYFNEISMVDIITPNCYNYYNDLLKKLILLENHKSCYYFRFFLEFDNNKVYFKFLHLYSKMPIPIITPWYEIPVDNGTYYILGLFFIIPITYIVTNFC